MKKLLIYRLRFTGGGQVRLAYGTYLLEPFQQHLIQVGFISNQGVKALTAIVVLIQQRPSKAGL